MGKEKQEKRKKRLTAQSFCRLNDRLEFARQMVDVASDASKAQDVFAFFCYFVAFNILYEFCRGSDSHWVAVKRLIEEEDKPGYQMPHPAGDDRFPHLNGRVLDGRRSLSVADAHENDWIKNEPKENVKVFLRILQVRNNLFHGSKELNDHRDMPLIREANVVLREFLLWYFERRHDMLNVTEGGEE